MKKLKYLVLLLILSLGLVACSARSDEDDTKSDRKDRKEKKEQSTDDDDSESRSYIYEHDMEDEEEGDTRIQRYELYLNDDGTAEMYDISDYKDGHDMSYHYVGTYTESEGKIVFDYKDSNEEDTWIERYTYSINDDGEVTEVVYDYVESGVESAAGTYTGHSSEYGDMTLVIDAANNATLTVEDGTEYTGSIFIYNEKWDLMVNDEDYETSFDWVIEFDGDTFTYEEYTKSVYGKYAGDYKCIGDLDEFVLHVDAYGNCNATVVVEGDSKEFSGSITIDSEYEIITEAYMSSDDGYGLQLELQDWGNNSMNYSGYYAVPLGAG